MQENRISMQKRKREEKRGINLWKKNRRRSFIESVWWVIDSIQGEMHFGRVKHDADGTEPKECLTHKTNIDYNECG